ncbi:MULTISPECIES: hypothetical protein [unclassified Amycolatopsis]|uniref:hypothetical protein n=1 Tax=unclassified Amycolatopsis TaxID=2618356 RepID=UPI002E0D8D22|nr:MULTISPECIES: hypothetical protein [unclassified Amycolatopsis]WSJ75795.1 hypothetical protein OG439_41345 [Amycolatopsis sp. NBC_01307]WSK80606.1 hypothetical protein OG570_08575 [Amycolatopsis sp. NBC_01286]
MMKKLAAVAFLAFAVTTAVSAPASAAPAASTAPVVSAAPVTVQGFTLLKQTSGNGRTLRLWQNTGNGLVHGSLSGAQYGDQLYIGNCCYPYVTYETVTSTGQYELNTQEYGNYGPRIGGVLADGGQLYL